MQKVADSEKVIKKYEGIIATYDKEKKEKKTQAEGFQKEYDDINVFDDQLDMTEAFPSIAIAMFGIIEYQAISP